MRTGSAIAPSGTARQLGKGIAYLREMSAQSIVERSRTANKGGEDGAISEWFICKATGAD